MSTEQQTSRVKRFFHRHRWRLGVLCVILAFLAVPVLLKQWRLIVLRKNGYDKTILHHRRQLVERLAGKNPPDWLLLSPDPTIIVFSREDPDHLYEEISRYTWVREIYIRSSVTERQLALLGELPNVEGFYISFGNSNISADKLLEFLDRVPNLRRLKLGTSPQLGDECLARLEQTKSLKWLHIGRRHSFSGDAVRRLRTALPELEVVGTVNDERLDENRFYDDVQREFDSGSDSVSWKKYAKGYHIDDEEEISSSNQTIYVSQSTEGDLPYTFVLKVGILPSITETKGEIAYFWGWGMAYVGVDDWQSLFHVLEFSLALKGKPVEVPEYFQDDLLDLFVQESSFLRRHDDKVLLYLSGGYGDEGYRVRFTIEDHKMVKREVWLSSSPQQGPDVLNAEPETDGDQSTPKSSGD
jgi:hypothetical protein